MVLKSGWAFNRWGLVEGGGLMTILENGLMLILRNVLGLTGVDWFP
jgi:hypothetical protein